MNGPYLPSGDLLVGFSVDSNGVADLLIVSTKLDAAVDILTDDGYPLNRAVEILHAAEASGRDPEVFARHMVRLRKAL